MSDDPQNLTYGQRLVQTQDLADDPAAQSDIETVRSFCAKIIDQCVVARERGETQGLGSDDYYRMFTTAITQAQTACMWAVKAISYRE